MLWFARALALVRRAMLISSTAATTRDWLQQHRVRSQLNPYQLQLLGFQSPGAWAHIAGKRQTEICCQKRRKPSLLGRKCFLSSFCFCTSKRVGFCSPYLRKPNWFCYLSAWCLIPSDATLQLFRCEPVAEWSWALPAVSRHNGLLPVSLAAHVVSNHQKD